MKHRNIAVVLAGGKGARFGAGLPKQFLLLGDKTVLEYSVDAFEQCEYIDEIWIVINSGFREFTDEIIHKRAWKKVVKLIDGGAERYFSTLNALYECADLEANLIFHDAARPAITQRIINDVVNAMQSYEACAVAIPPKDTIFKLSADGKNVEEIPSRSIMCLAQTPQAFRAKIIKQAYDLALSEGFDNITDDCGVVHRYLPQVHIHIVQGDVSNIKITTSEDMKWLSVSHTNHFNI